jgi:proteasome assembly chaperone (PAC2) family protein
LIRIESPERWIQMDDLVELWERPIAEEIYMIAGWHQWADAGNTSSGLPQYLISHTKARKIGQIKPRDFYLFQVPGLHHFLRPEVKLKDGYRKELRTRRNEIFYSEQGKRGLVIFLGDEPHLNENRYAEAFFNVVEGLDVDRVACVGGVYGEMPYDKDREISCVYSLQEMKDELDDYAVRFSNYEGGTTIGTYLVDKAERKGVEFLVFYAFVPAYDFAQASILTQGMRIENDFKAWYDLMRRLNHMFGLQIDLSDLQERSDELFLTTHAKLEELKGKMPQLRISEYMEQVAANFTERPFMPLGDLWERALGDIFEDIDD